MKSVKTLQEEIRLHWNDPNKLLSSLSAFASRADEDAVALSRELIGRLFEIVKPTFPFHATTNGGWMYLSRLVAGHGASADA